MAETSKTPLRPFSGDQGGPPPLFSSPYRLPSPSGPRYFAPWPLARPFRFRSSGPPRDFVVFFPSLKHPIPPPPPVIYNRPCPEEQPPPPQPTLVLQSGDFALFFWSTVSAVGSRSLIPSILPLCLLQGPCFKTKRGPLNVEYFPQPLFSSSSALFDFPSACKEACGHSIFAVVTISSSP